MRNRNVSIVANGNLFDPRLRIGKPQHILMRHIFLMVSRAKVLPKSTSKKGVAGICSPTTLAAPSRNTAQSCGFSIHASSFGGLNGEPHGSPVNGLRQCPGLQTCSSRHPRFAAGVAVFQPTHWRPYMANRPLVPATGQSLDAIARHQHVHNAISTAQWHLRHGRVNEAAGRILVAARHLKNACNEAAKVGSV